MNNTIDVVGADDIAQLLEGRELDLIEWVLEAYLLYRDKDAALPHSTFLRFPGDDCNRIIALPAYLGGRHHVAGIKWIASFPDNIQKGLDRAQAVVILNSMDNGRPTALLEGSIISAKRTAAGAALAARTLHPEGEGTTTVGLIGVGRINFEILRFLLRVFPRIQRVVCYDPDVSRVSAFTAKAQTFGGDFEVISAQSCMEVLTRAPLVSFATTAVQPYFSDLSSFGDGTTILNISLRDFMPEAVLAADNIVDDVDHVCRANTSLHLTEQSLGNRQFIRASLADILSGQAPARAAGKPTIFSPFGMGILDLIVAEFIYGRAKELNINQSVPRFFANQC